MSGLTIHGAHGLDVWLETDGDLYCLTVFDLRVMRNDIRGAGAASRWGVTFDEADVTALIKALAGRQLEDCQFCEGPGLVEVEGRAVCPGHADGFGWAEDESMEAAR